ncbi:histone deacetylase complex subunit SAP130 isoform X2 [Nasonia vitripennis]|uniref:Histone deacetylase complex subunit SAP130 C-terminal domain-containing protein n=1 Tax=Nasonia vitripennis TaxID=7425 RepID=A0A7M7LNV6_NASVI|nr:histone deacetylase complex subunit SAP130 isoform X2 [Nasonia vitripennis]
MSANNSGGDGGQDKAQPETNVQTVPQNLTTIQSIQNVVSSGISSIQTAQAVMGQAGTLVGKSISLELNPKLIMKPSIPSSIGSSSESNKITTGTICPVGSTVRIIAPNMLSTIERQGQTQVQQGTQQTQQIVTSIPSTYHVPRGPAAVANISTPRATVATPLVRAISAGQPIPISRPGLIITSSSVSTTVPSTQWQAKTTSLVYAQTQRHPVPVVNRPPTRPVTTVYTSQPQAQPQGQQQPRLVSPSQVSVGRPVQATVVTATPSRLIAPVLQAQNNSGGVTARLPTPARPPTTQVVTSIANVSQAGRAVAQTIQPNLTTSRPISSTPINRIAVSAPVIGAPNRVATVTSVQTSVGRQLTINTAAGTSAVSRIVIPQAIQQQQPQQQQGAQRVVQTVTPLANFSQVSRVIATTSTNAGVAGNVTRVAQTGPTSVARITGMSLHPLPLTPARATPTPLKVTAQAPGIQTVQLKQLPASMQPQSQLQVQVQQHQQQQQQQGPALQQRTISSINNANVTSASIANQQPGQIQGQYLHPQQTATYYSIDTSGGYPQYRQTSVQPVRLLVEPGFEEPLGKPNASPRPSILRKRDHDGSPAKGVAKNLVPVLASMPSASASSPPGSPKGDRDGGGNHSSGSTTVSATSSPGLDEDPEQSRITINPTVEMSPRKKPRKQQLTGVELTEPRCTEEEMQFITEEKIKKEVKEEPKEKYDERKSNANLQQDRKTSQPASVRSKPTPSLIGQSWKNRFGHVRLNHYKRPSDVKPREERRPTVNEIAQQKHVLQKVNGWKVFHLTSQMDDLAELEKSVHDKLKSTLTMLESQQVKNRPDDSLERTNELIKGNMQRSSLISEGMHEARVQLTAIFQHKTYVADLLQRCGNKRAQKKRDK